MEQRIENVSVSSEPLISLSFTSERTNWVFPHIASTHCFYRSGFKVRYLHRGLLGITVLFLCITA